MNKFFIFLFLFAMVACQHSPNRTPQVYVPKYDPVKKQLLNLAAQKGITFVLSDELLKEAPASSLGDRCRKLGDPIWSDAIYSLLGDFQKEPQLLNKIHFIEIKKGDSAKAEISEDQDQARTLVISFAKFEKRQKIKSINEIPCQEAGLNAIDQEMVVTDFEWPLFQSVRTVLQNTQERPNVPRLDFDTRFLVWLANQQTILKVSHELTFERDLNGESLIKSFLNNFSNVISITNKEGLYALEFWLDEISKRSNQGENIKFFGIKRDLQLTTGIHVDTEGRFARKLNGNSDPTFPFVSYRTENGQIRFATFDKLNQCLSKFQKEYLSANRSPSSKDVSPDGFLFPGHYCPESSDAN